MSEEQKPEAGMQDGASAPEGAVSGAPEGVSPEQLVEALNAENATLKDRMLRAVAELENLRKRAEKEVADARLYGVQNFAREMLGVADNLRRAVQSIPADMREAENLKALVEGVELTERDLIARLGRFGVKKLDPQGQKFDPNFHEALFEAPDASVPNGTVVQVMEEGYAIGERVLRPAKVGVSRGGPKVVN